ncbi:DUF421 domain-containing protein [Paenibacillus sp. GP183]|jgi:uncharacterized membrane protein YcaP (DUF421 family)|uniref:DUF421 domain-containing protein n=1 Tax=Paenibacillus sp. GP183 TaxID=1882751 RepID=UPI00089CFF1F|nr:DUF421 domain-containing protein [Paenibacillus sp. GP183]SEC28412.1 Uncharacterized membrane protein YcaP, DUF421 family [Paenibacillus sp. GP183]
MPGYMEILIRTLLAFLLLLIVTRILGKQTVSNMTFNDFASAITLGGIAANLAFNVKVMMGYIILSLLFFGVISYAVSVAALKNRKWRKWISGSPTVLIEGGKILEDNMRKIRYNLDSLNQALREKNIFDVEEVEYAVLEDNGKVSVKKKDEYEFVTKKDLKLRLDSALTFPVELIMDGKIIQENLAKSGLSMEKLQKELSKRNKAVSDVFYLVKGTQNQLIFDFYQDSLKNPIDK